MNTSGRHIPENYFWEFIASPFDRAEIYGICKVNLLFFDVKNVITSQKFIVFFVITHYICIIPTEGENVPNWYLKAIELETK